MNDPYLIPGTSVLKNKLNLTLQPDLDEAEADYAALRLRELAVQPLPGNYGVRHYLSFHRYIFQDLYNWAGEPRRMNIMKEEPALGGLSVEYTDYPEIRGRAFAGTVRDAQASVGEVWRRQADSLVFSRYGGTVEDSRFSGGQHPDDDTLLLPVFR